MACVLFALVRERPAVAEALRRAPAILAAGALAALVVLVPGLPPLADAAAGVVAFPALLLAFGRFPPEIGHALRGRDEQAVVSMRACPICGGEGEPRLTTTDTNRALGDERFEYRTCRDCATLYLGERPGRPRALYPPDYYPLGESQPGNASELAKVALLRRVRRRRRADRDRPRRGRLRASRRCAPASTSGRSRWTSAPARICARAASRRSAAPRRTRRSPRWRRAARSCCGTSSSTCPSPPRCCLPRRPTSSRAAC